MQSPNKINSKEQEIINRQEKFHHFLKGIKHSHQPDLLKLHHQDSESKHQCQSSNYNQSEVLNIHKELDHYQVLSFSDHHQQNPTTDKKKGDEVIRNKIRYSVGNRNKVNNLQLPSYCFNQMKQKLDEYFKQNKKSSHQYQEQDINLQTNLRPNLQKQHNLTAIRQKRTLLGRQKIKKLIELNENIVIRYCQYNKLTNKSSLKDITSFFVKLLQLVNYSIPNPKIQKYTDCVYFGDISKRNNIYEGIIYYYNADIYYGELYHFQKHGYGVQIQTDTQKIFKGEFKEGQMVGHFQVKSQNNEIYYGELQNSRYHGHGRIIDQNGTFQGQFRNGSKTYEKNYKKDMNNDSKKRSYLIQNTAKHHHQDNDYKNYQRSSSTNFQPKNKQEYQLNQVPSKELTSRNKSYNNRFSNHEDKYYQSGNRSQYQDYEYEGTGDSKKFRGKIVNKDIRNTLRDFSYDFSAMGSSNNPETFDNHPSKTNVKMPRLYQQSKRSRNFKKQRIQEQQLEDQTSQQQEPLKSKI